MPNYHIFSIGCQMNQAEAERLESLFDQKGYTLVDAPETADLVLLVSCSVRQGAEDRIINRLAILNKLKRSNPSLRIALTGCMVTENIAAMERKFPMVDHFFPAGTLPDFLDSLPLDILPAKPDIATFVPIIQGCDNFCSYCIVPYRRGRERSRTPDEIVAEVTELVRRGAREVTLLGQNVNAYGHDLEETPDLADLLMVLDNVKGLERIRFLTNHPKDMTRRLIEVMAEIPKVCPALNLPAQSGDDEILRLMRRGYTSNDYRLLLAGIRESIPGIAITTDLILGFPGESRAQFENTLAFVDEMKFDAVHAAVYSAREGTEAAEKFPDDVPKFEKELRLRELETLQKGIASKINAGFAGSEVEVLVEELVKGKWRGRERHGKLVFFESRGDLRGKLVQVKIVETGPWSLRGDMVNP